MAVNKKFTHQFKPNPGGGVYRVNLCDTAFSGTVSDIEMTSEPFVLSWNNDDPHAKVISSECTFNFICQTQAQVDYFTDVAGDRTGRYTVEILEGVAEDLMWAGVIQADSVTIPFESLPVVIGIQANDDLARLADSFHNQSGIEGGTPYAATDELMHVHIRRALSRIRTFHHWESTDNFLQMFSYYVTTGSSNSANNNLGLTEIAAPSAGFDTSPQGTDVNTALSDLQVLEDICLIFNSRLMLQNGAFRFHSLAHLQQAPNFEVDVINYRKDGVLFSPITIDIENSFNDITKLAGWSSTFLPGLRQVSMETLGGFIAAVGRVQFLPPFNQITMVQDGGANDLDGTFYNTPGGATPFSLNGEGAFFAIRQTEQALFDTWVQVAFDPFQLNDADLENECIRLKISILLLQDLTGTNSGTTQFGTNSATFDSILTQPVIGEGGESIECASVAYSENTYSSSSSQRLVRFSEPIHCGGNNARSFSQRIQFELPAIDTTATGAMDFGIPKVGALLEVVAHDGQPLSSADLATVNNAWIIGHLVAPSIYSSANQASIDPDTEKTQWVAAVNSSDFRESLELGTTSFGFGANNPLTLTTASGAAVPDWTSPGNVDGTDWIAQLVVKDVLRLRSKPREVFRGNGFRNASDRAFSFNKIYTHNSQRFALLGCRLDGATNFSEATFFELTHDTSTVVGEGFEDALVGSRFKFGKGQTAETSTAENNHEFLSALSFQQTADQVRFITKQLVPTSERMRAKNRLLANGQTIARADLGNLNTPGFSLFTANADATDVSRHAIQLEASTSVSNTEIITLPPLPAVAGKYLMQSIVGSTGQEFDPGIIISGNVGDVLQLASQGGQIVAEFAAASGGTGSGGFYSFRGHGKPGRTPSKFFFNFSTNVQTSRQQSGENTIAVPEGGTVAEFALYSHGTGSSSGNLDLFLNGATTVTERETVTLTADGVDTGTFSTSVSAGDRLQFSLTPLANHTSYSLTVKISV